MGVEGEEGKPPREPMAFDMGVTICEAGAAVDIFKESNKLPPVIGAGAMGADELRKSNELPVADAAEA